MKNDSKYLEIYRRLRSEIENGAFAPGSRMLSKREAAERFGVSLITVAHTYELLCDEGYLTAKERSGFFVSFRADNSFPVASGAMPEISRSGASGEDCFPFSVYARTMRRTLAEYAEDIFIKSPNSGLEQLRTAIARYLGRSRGIDVKPAQIYIGSGAEHLYSIAVKMLGREQSYAIEKPSYRKIEQVYRAEGIECEHLALCGDGIDSRELEASRAGVLHITPYRSFPSNISASATKKHEYLAWAQKRGAVIIEDDCESEFTPSTKPEDTVFAMDKSGCVVYINSFSRTISPAVRTGYMVVPEKLLPALEEAAGFYSCTVPTLDQLVLTQLLDSGDFERHLNRVRRKNRRI